MKRILILLVLVSPFLVLSVTQRAEAVPSFARQIKAPCSACHTIWPNLNQYGRQFKVKAYTDASPDWDVIKNDRLNLFYVFPVSARILFSPYQIEQDAQASFNQNLTQIDNMQIFIASRIFKYAGVFTSVESGSIPGGNFTVAVSKLAFARSIGDNTLGAVLFWGLPTAADPFNSFGGWDRDIASPDDEVLPWVVTKGWTGSSWSGSSYGGTLHGYFLGNRLYAAITATRGGDVADADKLSGDFMHQLPGTPFATAEGVQSNPFGFIGRVAWDQSIPNGSVTLGGAVSTGVEKVLAADGATVVSTHVNRQFIDASLEQDLGDSGQHLVEAKGIFGFGQETGLSPFSSLPNGSGFTGLGTGDKRSFTGGDVEADYFYNRTYGIVGQYNWINNAHVDPADFDPATSQHTWLASLNYLPWYNTKIQFIYANVKSNYLTGGTVTSGSSETDKIYKFMVDVVF